ncbi:MAG: hydrogenase maturation protease [Candidatus Omnitrophica bacterium]|nr:hydrogenase maturation protease [Candidatus Omnitrophota bacterium]MDD5436433.1 hydrogenase maturation protease [Candidatus Omnitrophota bacterium]
MSDIKGCSAQDAKSVIKERLKGKVAVVGIGSIIRGDDGLGPKFIEIMRSKSSRAELFDCGTAPENYIIPILSTSCDTVALVDAADMGLEPGGIRIFDLDEIANVSFSTHNPSPRLFTDFLKTGKDDLNIFVASIQPKETTLGAPISEEVLRGINILADAFSEALNG